MPGDMVVSVLLRPVASGTDIAIEQTNVPSVSPLDACNLGGQQSLAQLAQLVEPNMPD